MLDLILFKNNIPLVATDDVKKKRMGEGTFGPAFRYPFKQPKNEHLVSDSLVTHE